MNFTTSKKINNSKYRIPVISCAGFTNLAKNYEPWLDNFLKKVLPANKPVVLDVGVNIGQTILKLASLKKDVTYIGFEPNPTCYFYSQKLIEANNFKNYKLFPVGLADKFKVLPLFGDNDYAAGASVIVNFRKNTNRYRPIYNVTLAEGDEILASENISKIDLIKVDIEGAELEAMKGLAETVRNFQPLIMLEILPVYSLDNENGILRKQRQDELLALLKEYGYQSYLIDEQNCLLNTISTIPVHSDMGRTNYFFIPTARINNFAAPIPSQLFG